jgi:rod shape determining protein RodA
MASIAAPLGRRRTSTETSIFTHVDLVLFALPLALSAFGLLMIYDSSKGKLARAGLSPYYYVERQGIAIAIGFAAMVVVMMIDYRRFRDFWALIFIGILPLLAAVLVLGRNHKGAQAWFQVGPMQFQPSEVAKIAVVVAIAGYCHAHRGDLDAWRLAVAIGLAGAVMAIVYAQHDLGTMLVIMVCAGAVLVIAGLKPVHIAVLLMLAGTLIAAAVVTGKVEAYQFDRLTSFADQGVKDNPAATKDQSNARDNLTASKRAIGSGGLTGAGLFEGRQTSNGFVPEQHTDFIFTAVGEDLGFVGGACLIALYGLLVWRIWRIALLSGDFFGTLVAVGVLAMFAIQVFENIGMTMGIMPITGIPLPFMSYGGSAVIASFIAIGLVLNVHMRRFS